MIEILMKISSANFLRAINEFCVTLGEFHFTSIFRPLCTAVRTVLEVLYAVELDSLHIIFTHPPKMAILNLLVCNWLQWLVVRLVWVEKRSII
jgi:hypothetical protein